MSDRPEGDYSLVMPFVSCVSNGGPHDDESYVCGWECGALDRELGARNQPYVWKGMVHRANLPQIELIAMKHGYIIVKSEEVEEAWQEICLLLSSPSDF